MMGVPVQPLLLDVGASMSNSSECREALAEPLGALTATRSSCPGCGQTKWVTTGSPVKAFAVQARGREFWQPDFRALRCQHCDLVFKSAIASPAVLADYYAVVDFRKWETPCLLPTETRVLAALRQLPPHSRILDFGCSTGRLLSELVGEYHCFGLEINQAAAQLAREKGLTILAEQELFQEAAHLDAIVLVDVYEHLDEPTHLLQRLTQALRPGGRLVLCTGNADAPAVRGDPATYWYFQNVEHLNMLTRGHADYLGRQLGLRLAQWEAVCHYRPALVPWLREWSQTFAHGVFHGPRGSWLRPVLRLTPYLRRAEHWSQRPARRLTADHVIAVFEKVVRPNGEGQL